MNKFGQRQFSLSISSWFCIPEQGMKEFEILSRASAFVVKANSSLFKYPYGNGKNNTTREISKDGENNRGKFFQPEYHILTASHVVSPWRWPKYYPDEWLQYVSEKHTHYTVELRDESGVFITQSECVPVSYHHKNRDLAVLHLENEAENIAMLHDLGFNPMKLLLPQKDKPMSQTVSTGQTLEFLGHDVTNTDAGPNWNPREGDGKDQRKPIPMRSFGQIQGRSQAQVFCRTTKTLTDGMCGGPVLINTNNNNLDNNLDNNTDPNNISKKKRSAVSTTNEYSQEHIEADSVLCVGMTEGIVPVEHADRSLQGLAVFVESPDIQDFLLDIEAGENKRYDCLIGGESIQYLAENEAVESTGDQRQDILNQLKDNLT